MSDVIRTADSLGNGFAYFRWMELRGRLGQPTYFWAWRALQGRDGNV